MIYLLLVLCFVGNSFFYISLVSREYRDTVLGVGNLISEQLYPKDS